MTSSRRFQPQLPQTRFNLSTNQQHIPGDKCSLGVLGRLRVMGYTDLIAPKYPLAADRLMSHQVTNQPLATSCLPSQQGYIHQPKLIICQVPPSSKIDMKNMTTTTSETQIIYKIRWLILSDLFNWQRTNIQDTTWKHSQIGSLHCAVLGLLGVQFIHKLFQLWRIPAHVYC